MKKIYSTLCVLLCVCSVISVQKTSAQCLVGYTQSQLNWDYLDFLPSNVANYNTWYTSATRPYDQSFSMGTRRVNFRMSPTANITLNGENYSNTADAGSVATPGAKVQFTTTSSASTNVTMTFDTDVMNVVFSLYDVDQSQRINITANNSASVAQVIVLANANVASGIAIAGSGTTFATATAPAANYATTDNRGTVNVGIVGPVSSITLNLITNAGDFWLSDITACVTGSFPSTYRNVSQPFTGQPSYILTVRDSVFYMLNPATGEAKYLFDDPGWGNMNGMGYDPYNRILYYTYSLTTTPSATKTIYKYSVDNGTIGVAVADVTAPPLNIPTYDPGVTSGSASFYNGSLYFGVEASNPARTSTRENTVWKIDFDASQNPIRASQVYAAKVDSNIAGTDRLIHDWSDIGVTNGMIYDFDGAGAGTANLDSMYYHFNLMTGQRVQFAPNGAGNIGPKQTAIDWQENVYNMGGLPTRSSNAQTIGGFIVPYNYNGSVNNAQNRLVFTMPGPVYPIGSWGDCSEAFRPLCDFGDAPASYDPVALSPAVNEKDTALKIGVNYQWEWTKTSSALANADPDEDGVGTVTIFNPLYNTYQVQVSVYNHTGVNAALIGWLDWNGNGVFDAGEASATVTLPSTTAMQNPWLSWTGISSSLASGSFTYLRIRVTTSTMTSANATGWFNNGETEDYRVSVSTTILPVTLISFDAKAISNSKVKLTWTVSDEANLSGYEIQRSTNGSTWEYVNFVSATQATGIKEYELVDNSPYKGTSNYRLKIKEGGGQSKYSEIRTVKITDLSSLVILTPNPASTNAKIKIVNNNSTETAGILVYDSRGAEMYYQKIKLVAGNNFIELPVQSWPSNSYTVLVSLNDETISKKLILRR